jgi:muramidase (phage lysozyme)
MPDQARDSQIPEEIVTTSRVLNDVSSNATRYLVVESEGEAGGLIALSIDSSGQARLLAADTPIDWSKLLLPDDVLSRLQPVQTTSSVASAAVWTPPPGTPPSTQAGLNAAVAAEAKSLVGKLITKDVPQTDHGVLACAWALNHVVLGAIGKQVGGDLSTDNMYAVLKAQDHRLDDGQSGCVVISPTQGAVHGHAGIVGQDVGPDGSLMVYSNSSAHGQWMRNYTIDAWHAYFGRKEGLDVQFYELDVRRFQPQFIAELLEKGTTTTPPPDKVRRFKPMLDFIALHEGTANQPHNGYNTSLGYGIFIGGEKDLVSMTLLQIDVLQTEMLNNPGNTLHSSALGRYQIVRTTLRNLKTQLRLSETSLFDEHLQDELGVALILGRGRNVSGLRLEWASLQNVSSDDILAAYDDIGT